MGYRGPLKAVVFDWAGTTVDFRSRAPVLAFVRTFQQFGIDLSEAEARGPMGLAKRDHLKPCRSATYWSTCTIARSAIKR
jgi:phosphonoacetaldehyde hydrolase